jgi:hypothetical protein
MALLYLPVPGKYAFGSVKALLGRSNNLVVSLSVVLKDGVEGGYVASHERFLSRGWQAFSSALGNAESVIVIHQYLYVVPIAKMQYLFVWTS